MPCFRTCGFVLQVLRQSRETDEARGYSALHYCVLYNAPIRLIEKLITLSLRDQVQQAAFHSNALSVFQERMVVAFGFFVAPFVRGSSQPFQ